MTDVDAAASSPVAPWRRWVVPVGGALLVLLYLAVSLPHVAAGAREPDTAGYLWMADRLARFQLPLVVDDDPFLYQSHVWVENARGEIAAKYTPGLPAWMALGMWLGGEYGAFVINTLAGALALIGIGLLAGELAGVRARLPAMGALLVSPIFLPYVNYPLAHAPNLAAITWGAWWLWRWVRTRGWGSGIGAGLCLGFAAVVRPSSALMALVVGLGLLAAFLRAERRPWGRAAALAGAYALFPLLNALYNWRLFGSPWLTGYALSDEQGAFEFGSLLGNLDWTLRGLAGQITLLFFGLGVLGMCLAPRRLDRLMRLAWWVPLWLLYASYYWAFEHHGTAFFRFYICLIPIFIVSAFTLLEQLRLSPRRYWSSVAVLLLLSAIGGAPAAWQGLQHVSHSASAQAQARAAEIIVEHLPADAVLLTTGAAVHRLGRGSEIRLYDLDAFRPRRRPRDNEPRQQEARRERIEAFYEANAEQLDQLLRQHVGDFLADGRTVAVAIPERHQHRVRQQLGNDFELVEVSTWPMPDRDWRRENGRYISEAVERPWQLSTIHPRPQESTHEP